MYKENSSLEHGWNLKKKKLPRLGNRTRQTQTHIIPIFKIGCISCNGGLSNKDQPSCWGQIGKLEKYHGNS